MTTTKPSATVERIYPASLQELWELWTTKEGFESWWGPVGFRVEVHAIDPRPGGKLDYDMIADAPEQIAAMKAAGQPVSHGTHGTFAEVEKHRRLKLVHVIDFIPGVTPYESTIIVEFEPLGDRTRMTVKLYPMHDKTFTGMQVEGFTSQLTKLDDRYGWKP